MKNTYEHGIVNGMTLISHSSTHVLFNMVASYSFISLQFAQLLGLEFFELDYVMTLGTSMRSVMNVTTI